MYAFWFLAVSSPGQTPPANDNYANRTVLTGTELTFSGSLAGATVEDVQEQQAFSYWFGSWVPTESIWWTWTAPASGTLTFQMLGSSLGDSTNQWPVLLAVYAATNGSSSPAGLNLPALASEIVDFRVAMQPLSIPVTNGGSYQIQLIGSNSASYSFKMVSTNAPVVFQQPRSQTVYSNASALFYVVAADLALTDLTYQWFFDGTAIAGETAPMLALTNINSTMAGAYSVSVSNAMGYTISQPAILAVSRSNVPVSLTAIGLSSNTFGFSLTGESNRDYRIESSTDLIHWTNAVNFVISPCVPDSTSVVFNSNNPLRLTVANGPVSTFFRATPYVLVDSNTEICVNNLRKSGSPSCCGRWSGPSCSAPSRPSP